MSKEESPSVIIKSEPPCTNAVHCINDKIFLDALDETKTEIDLKYIKKDMVEESLMEVKQEEIIIKDEIATCSDTQNDLTDNNVVFTVDLKLSPTLNITEPTFSTGEKQFACIFCQYTTSRKQDIKQHMNRHTRAKTGSYAKFQFAECEYETPRKMDLVCHMGVHTGEKPFACTLCKFKTAVKGKLKCHMMKHTGETKFACNLCEFKTTQKHYLKRHVMKHTREKPFSCNSCEYKTAQKNYLKSHMMKHTGEKPFACNVCEFRTARKGNLKSHIIKHIGEKPFA